MTGSLDHQALMRICVGIGNEAADEFGFVSVKCLLQRLDARLVVRPLLAEGMLAKVDAGGSTERGQQAWLVLVDRDRYPIHSDDVERESSASPLNDRLRFTIAHELVHSMAYRSTEFGFDLERIEGNFTTREQKIEAFEQLTDRLAPLLLWSEKALTDLLANSQAALSVEQLATKRRMLGISRWVLVHRLKALGAYDPQGLLQRVGLANMGIGIGKWTGNGRATLIKTPIFMNFSRNIVPSPLLRIAGHDRAPADEIFQHESFRLSGGVEDVVEYETEAGTPRTPDAQKMRIECSVESTQRLPDSTFLYVIRRVEAETQERQSRQTKLKLQE